MNHKAPHKSHEIYDIFYVTWSPKKSVKSHELTYLITYSQVTQEPHNDHIFTQQNYKIINLFFQFDNIDPWL